MKRISLTAANLDRTRKLMEHLVAAFEQYCNEVSEEEVPYVDAFMAVHNFHKAIVLDLAHRGEMDPDTRRFFIQTAIDTFTEAMEQEQRKASH